MLTRSEIDNDIHMPENGVYRFGNCWIVDKVMVDARAFKFIDAVSNNDIGNIVREQAYACERTEQGLFARLALADIGDILPKTVNLTFMDRIREFARQGEEITGADNFFYNYRIAVQKIFKERKNKDYLCFSTHSRCYGEFIYKDLSVSKLGLENTPCYSTEHYNTLLKDVRLADKDIPYIKSERHFIRLNDGRSRNRAICNKGPASELMWKTTNSVKTAITAQIQTDPDLPNFLPLLLGKNSFTVSSTKLDDFHYTYLPISQYLREPEALFNLNLFSLLMHKKDLPSKEEVESTAKDLYRLRQRHCVRIGTL